MWIPKIFKGETQETEADLLDKEARLVNSRTTEVGVTTMEKEADFMSVPIHVVSYNGENTVGEMGLAKSYTPDFRALRVRSWQSFYESEIAQMVIRKFNIWAIGKGLRLQSEPIKILLENNGISNFNADQFSKEVEAAFKVFTSSLGSDFSGMTPINKLAQTALKNAYIGGDVLVIQRMKNGKQTVQLVDGANVVSPLDSGEYTRAEKAGNRIIEGVEVDKNGKHVAFFVYDINTNKAVRVKARNRRGIKTAFLVYGMKYRISHTRGVPLIAVVLQKLKSVDRYSEATVSGAEERSKVPFFVEHGRDSTGEDPIAGRIGSSLGNTPNPPNTDAEVQALAKKVKYTTNKEVYNLPQDSTIKTVGQGGEIAFKDFFTANIDIICSSIGIPPEVAKSMYENNFSSSRAAIGDWSHTLDVNRDDFSWQFYTPIFEWWLDSRVLSGKVKAPGYFEALINQNTEVLAAYRNARFVGARVPHIDPLKEVKAERALLGPMADHISLTTVEQSTENVGSGDFESNQDQFTEELKQAPKPEKPENSEGDDN